MGGGRHGVDRMVMAALMTALVAVVTIAVAVPVPLTNGYVHLGDSMVFMSVLVLGWKRAPLVAGLGSALADVFLGYPYWAPWTLAVKGGMALVAGIVMAKCEEGRRNAAISCVALAAAWLAFSAAVKWVVAYEGANNQAALLDKLEMGASAFGEMAALAQAQLMAFALAIPAVLAALSLALGRKGRAAPSLGKLLGMAGGGLFMVFGYYMAGGLIYGNFAYAAFSMPANVAQFLAGAVLAWALAGALGRTPARKFLIRFR